MTELFINGKPAVLSSGASIKLTAENVYFTKTSSYSYEIELPIDALENRAIFGNICRLDCTPEDVRYPARLVVDNVTVLTGEAAVTGVTESSVKVQLLGENAAYNYGNKMDSLYLDEMDLGDWFWETWPDGSYVFYKSADHNSVPTRAGEWSYVPEGVPVRLAADVLVRLYHKTPADATDDTYSYEEVLQMVHSGELGWVAFPTYNETGDQRHNAVMYMWRIITGQPQQFYPQLRGYEGERGYSSYGGVATSPAFSVQPMVWKMCEVVAKRTGFTLAREDNYLYTNTFFRKLFAASTSTSALCCKSFPHWTVNEWWEQIENTFGVVMHLDYSTNTMTLRSRSEQYSGASAIALGEVVDEHEVEMDDDSATDISASGVGYADADFNPEDILSEEIVTNAEIVNFDNMDDLADWIEDYNGELPFKKHCILRCAAEGRDFIFCQNYDGGPAVVEVNMLRPRLVGEESEPEIELRIVPARYVTKLADIYQYHTLMEGEPGSENRDIPIQTYDVRMLQVPGQAVPTLADNYDDTIDIEAILNEEDDAEAKEEEEKQDLLYIAIANSTPDTYINYIYDSTFRCEYARARLRERCYTRTEPGFISFMKEDEGESLSLIRVPYLVDIATFTVQGAVKIDTTKRRCVKFIADSIPDTGAVFLIRNRKFVCHKLEATIKPEGLDKLITGYFFELDD